MLTNNILTSDLIDIIFDGRNKDYGAYELRKSYSSIGKALMVTGILVSLTIGGVVLASSHKKSDSKFRVGGVVHIADLPKMVPEKIIEPENLSNNPSNR
jgi:protein TonB